MTVKVGPEYERRHNSPAARVDPPRSRWNVAHDHEMGWWACDHDGPTLACGCCADCGHAR